MVRKILGILLLPFTLFSIYSLISNIEKIGLGEVLVYLVITAILTLYALKKETKASSTYFYTCLAFFAVMDVVYLFGN